MKTLKQEEDLEDYITKFLILKSRAGINDDTILIELFMDRLEPALLEKVFTMENIPITLDGMIKAASKFDGNWRWARAIAGKAREHHERKPDPAPKTTKTLLNMN